MKALKLKFNNKLILAGVKAGITSFSVIIKNHQDSSEVWTQLSSLEENKIKHKYFEDYIDTGSKFSLEILDSCNSKDISSAKEVIDKYESPEAILQSKLKYYHLLKRELEEKGLI